MGPNDAPRDGTYYKIHVEFCFKRLILDKVLDTWNLTTVSQIAARARRAYVDSSKIKPSLRAVRSSPQKIKFPIMYRWNNVELFLITVFLDVKFSSQTTAIQTTTENGPKSTVILKVDLDEVK